MTEKYTGTFYCFCRLINFVDSMCQSGNGLKKIKLYKSDVIQFTT